VSGAMTTLIESNLRRASHLLADADAVLIGAGAGMSVDSGLPDYRGTKGFWTAYPAFTGRTYAEIAGPTLMQDNPEQAWAFFGHCLDLYRGTQPHLGYFKLREALEQLGKDYFVFTSNIDGFFGKSGYLTSNIYAVHGSIYRLQCRRGLDCGSHTWSAQDLHIDVDMQQMLATSALPRCIKCEDIARPNVLLFGDRHWVPHAVIEEENRYEAWLAKQKAEGKQILSIELGAGKAVPTVRVECQRRGRNLVRINLREFEAAPHEVSLPLSALEAIEGIFSGIRALKDSSR